MRPPKPALRSALLALTCTTCVSVTGLRAPAPVAGDDTTPTRGPEPETTLMPGPGRARLETAVAGNAACVSCHPAEAATWRASRHRQAATNHAFEKAFAAEPSAFCLDCHEPEGDGRASPPRDVRELGVGCVTCHVTEEGDVLASSGPGDRGSAPHAVRRSVEFGRTGACAGCHEFRFPGVPGGDDDGRFMQTTVREHARVPTADGGCAACHMPALDGRRSHAFSQVRDPDWLGRALEATAERAGDRVRVRLVQTAYGHGFPTGDLFRRLEVGCEARDSAGRVVGRAARYLARQLVLLPGEADRQLVGDDRVFDRPATVELAVPPAPAGSRIAWWVTLQRVATVGTGEDPRRAVIESEVPIHSGVLP